jgi:tRNA (cmo5U34)-methyltransferase
VEDARTRPCLPPAGESCPHRTEGEATLLEEVPKNARRIPTWARAMAGFWGYCYSPALRSGRCRRLFTSDAGEVDRAIRTGRTSADSEARLGAASTAPRVVRCRCLQLRHPHLPHPRKRELYQEVWTILEPDGVFCNLEHVASPTVQVHQRFLDALGITPAEEDPSNKLLDMETQLQWLREIGFEDVG